MTDMLVVEQQMIDEYKDRIGQTICTVRRHRLKQEHHKLIMRKHRRNKMLIPTAATIFRYRGSRFYFTDRLGDDCCIQIDADGSYIARYLAGKLPRTGVRAYVKATIDYMVHYAEAKEENLQDDEDPYREIRIDYEREIREDAQDAQAREDGVQIDAQ